MACCRASTRATASRFTGADVALLVAVGDDEGELRYAGRVGTGFSAAQLADIEKTLRRIERKTPPVDDVPAADRPSRPLRIAAINDSGGAGGAGRQGGVMRDDRSTITDRLANGAARAHQAGVPVIRFIWLARTLYRIPEGHYIPRDTLQPVAQVYRVLRQLEKDLPPQDVIEMG